MKKALFLILFIFVVALTMSSCRVHKQKCPAYGQHQTESPVNNSQDKV